MPRRDIDSQAKAGGLPELARLFLKLGFIAFGGPAAHIAMMEDEVVKRRHWITHEHFLDLLGVTNLIPGPNSTEMAIHIGLVRAGWRGLVIAGVCFIVPAVGITLLFAHLYVVYGTLPQVAPFVEGIRPAIIAIVLGAIYRLGKPLVKKNKMPGVIGAVVALLSLLNVNEIVLLFAGGVAGILWLNRRGFGKSVPLFVLIAFLAPAVTHATNQAVSTDNLTLAALGLFFLKIGSILYGSGYVLVAFLQGGLVEARHWLTQTQLLDAIAVGQFTPGPVLSTSAFIGYLLLGLPGAAVSAVGIFLPSFVFVLLVSPFIPKLRNVPSLGAFLDGVNGSALGLMLAVCVTLGAAALTRPLMWIILVVAGVCILKWKIHPAWLVAGSALVSWLATSIQI